MGKYRLTEEQSAAVKIVSLFKKHWPENDGPELMNELEEILCDLTGRSDQVSTVEIEDEIIEWYQIHTW